MNELVLSKGVRRNIRSTSFSPAPWWRLPPDDTYRHPRGEIVCGDALNTLTRLRDETADIIFLDPPFNLGKHYGGSPRKADRIAEETYCRYVFDVLNAAIDVLKPGGALFLYHIPRWALYFADRLSKRLSFRHWIAISMKNSFARGRLLYPAHYALLYFTKGQPVHFQRPKIAPARCRHCHRLIKDYGGYLRFIQQGINLTDVWDDISPVRHKRYKHRAANELPPEIARRAIAISGVANGLFVDPFAGAGTSLLAAIEANMNFVACDREREHFNIMVDRIRQHTPSNHE